MKVWLFMLLVCVAGCVSTVQDVEPDKPIDQTPRSEGCTEKNCQDYGGCAWDAAARTCRPRSDEDCLLSVVSCEKMGACHMSEGECRVKADSDAECGRPRGELLVNWCRIKGLCTAREGVCTATREADCAASYGCELSGLCGLSDGRCLALEDAHCEASTRCKKKGRCAAVSGQCVVP